MTSTNRREEMDNIKDKNFKMQVGTAIVVVIFIAGLASAYTSVNEHNMQEIEKMEDNLAHHIVESEECKARLKALEAKFQASEVSYTEIKTKLNSIETTLLEIRQNLHIHSQIPEGG